ncbi:hypothetical protein [Nocardia vulneris]|uniref:Uncharacterized protein n=1 Tax=Nocardia vulneris TaxID=1141657 RepID=A0ABR4ZDP0_9NOCA|nr:hypothetical protein [Nocardia vulneris]KIA63391.1 hypothetical protein FG87_19555 [Nocardia vulneris]
MPISRCRAAVAAVAMLGFAAITFGAAGATPAESEFAPSIVHPVAAPTEETTKALIEQAQDRTDAAASIAEQYLGGGNPTSEGDIESSKRMQAEIDAARAAARNATDTATGAKAAAEAAQMALDALAATVTNWRGSQAGRDRFEAIAELQKKAVAAAETAVGEPDDVASANAAAEAQNKVIDALGDGEKIELIKV